mmetsp:Transcript_53969/g.167258  ORF Transcript_53969/g.167258 Transcript_53969/m.167258 type:complete len:233 (+) Transcript_53969:395-1093(+)
MQKLMEAVRDHFAVLQALIHYASEEQRDRSDQCNCLIGLEAAICCQGPHEGGRLLPGPSILVGLQEGQYVTHAARAPEQGLLEDRGLAHQGHEGPEGLGAVLGAPGAGPHYPEEGLHGAALDAGLLYLGVVAEQQREDLERPHADGPVVALQQVEQRLQPVKLLHVPRAVDVVAALVQDLQGGRDALVRPILGRDLRDGLLHDLVRILNLAKRFLHCLLKELPVLVRHGLKL